MSPRPPRAVSAITPGVWVALAVLVVATAIAFHLRDGERSRAARAECATSVAARRDLRHVLRHGVDIAPPGSASAEALRTILRGLPQTHCVESQGTIVPVPVDKQGDTP